MIGYFEILFDRYRHKLRHLIHNLDLAFEKLQKANNSFKKIGRAFYLQKSKNIFYRKTVFNQISTVEVKGDCDDL